MARLRIPKHSSALFTKTWKGDELIYVTEASSLPRPLLARIYDDACDLGFTLVSERTGREAVFYLTEEKQNDEGEILWWTLKSDQVSITIKIFND